MRILLLGKMGQVGWELQRALAPLGELIALDRNSPTPADLLQPVALREAVRQLAPQVIVNAAAYTAVDRAESEPDLARVVNEVAPGMLAEEAARADAWLVQYSTDYVFDGGGQAPWTESAPTGPLNVYGRTKLAGEDLIRRSGCRHLIFRTSWVYATRGANFAKTMLQLAQERERLAVVDDQFGSPTGAELVADVTAHALRMAARNAGLGGTYHVAASGETNWHAYACHVIERARSLGMPMKVRTDAISPVASHFFPTPARRPTNSRLATNKVCEAFDLVMPAWQRGVDRLVDEVVGSSPPDAKATR